MPKNKQLLEKTAKPQNNVIVTALITLVITALWPDFAAADTVDAQSLGDVICNIRDSIRPFVHIFNGLAYISGGAFVVKGLYLLKKHANNPDDSQTTKAIAHMLAGATLVALPALGATLQQTLGLSTADGGDMGCSAPAITTGATSLDQMMTNFVQNIYQPMINTISLLGIVMGIYLIFRGLVKASKVGTDPKAGSTHGIMVNLFIGAILVTLGGMLPAMTETLFGTGGPSNSLTSIIQWSQIVGSGVDTSEADATVKAILMFVQVIGVIGFIRGWLIIKNAVEGTGQATVPQGITHIIGGTMAINIGAMLRLFDATFGTGLTT
jgi:hypothetical protein